VHAFAVVARSHVTLYTGNVYVENINRHVRLMLFWRSQYIRIDENPSSDPIGLDKVYSVGTFDLALHRIIISAEHYPILSFVIVIVIIIIRIFDIAAFFTVNASRRFCEIARFVKLIYDL